MKIIQLFASVSCVSAAMLPVLNRSLAVKFNQIMNQNGSGNLADHQMSLTFPDLPQIPDLSPLGRVMPISYCDSPNDVISYWKRREKNIAISTMKEINGNDSMEASAKNAMKERLMIEASRISTPSTSNEPQSSGNKRFDPIKMDELFDNGSAYEIAYGEIAEAFKNGEIDYNYVPKSSFVIMSMLEIGYHDNTNEYLKKYYEAGTLEKMLDSGIITFEQMMFHAIGYPNFYLANLVLDLMIPRMLKEIDSDDFNVAKWRMGTSAFHTGALFWMNRIPLIPLDEQETEMLKFYNRWNHIFADTPLRHWKLGTIDCPLVDLY